MNNKCFLFYLEAQKLLEIYSKILINKFGMNSQIYQIIGNLWNQYLKKVYLKMNKQSNLNNEDYKKGDNSRKYTPNLGHLAYYGHPSPLLPLCFSFLACWILREPILETDFIE